MEESGTTEAGTREAGFEKAGIEDAAPGEAVTVVVSDAHLGAVPEENERAFHTFLESVPDLADDLLINGDLFDFWFEYRSAVLREHFPTLRRLADLSDAGVRMRLVGGNHDAWGGSFLRDELGIELLEGPLRLDLRGRRTFLAHGDGLAGGDWGYRALKRIVRGRAARTAFRLLHPDLSRPLVRRFSGTPERHGAGPGGEGGRADRLARYASSLLLENPELELVIFGHAHRPELREVSPGRFYLNPGDWIHHRSYAVIGRHTLELRTWSHPSTG